jgi:hypothetical protein
LAEVVALEATLWRDLSGSSQVSVGFPGYSGLAYEVKLDINRVIVAVTVCADSLAVLESVVGDLSNLLPSKPWVSYYFGSAFNVMVRILANIQKTPTTLDHSINVFGEFCPRF